jgi:uncharacterized integral membrane protein
VTSPDRLALRTLRFALAFTAWFTMLAVTLLVLVIGNVDVAAFRYMGF